MANKHVSLASLFTDTADAIREKTGTSEKIIADNFPDAIREISVGIDTSDATIESYEVMNGEIAYGSNGQVVGAAPFEFNDVETGFDILNIETISNSFWGAYGNGKFVILNTEGKAAYSENGIDWTEVELPVIADNYLIFNYVHDRFIAITYDGRIALSSTNGINWTQTTLPAQGSWIDIAYGNNMFTTILRDTNIALYSIDGINWVQTILPTSQEWTYLSYINDKFISIVPLSDVLLYSINGIDWIQVQLPKTGIWTNICHNNDNIMLALDTKFSNFIYSNDGINWMLGTLYQSSPHGFGFTDIIYANNKFITIRHYRETLSAVVLCSEDGINWNWYDIPDGLWSSIYYDNNKFITFGIGIENLEAKNAILYSEDGINWTYVELPVEGEFLYMAYDKNLFIGLIDYFTLIYSIDGINWNEIILSFEWAYPVFGENATIIIGSTDNHNICLTNKDFLKYKVLKNIVLSADNCETVELSIENNEIVLDSMFVDEETGV